MLTHALQDVDEVVVLILAAWACVDFESNHQDIGLTLIEPHFRLRYCAVAFSDTRPFPHGICAPSEKGWVTALHIC
jgi:hypothetical protein